MTRFRTLAVAALLAVSTALSACVQVRADSGKAAWCITGPTGALVTDGDGWCWIPAAVYPTIDLPSDPPPYPTTGT